MDSLTTRRFAAGDEGAVTRLYAETFGVAVEPEYWQWKYLRNPCGRIYVELAFDGERCVGQYAMLPLSLCVDGSETDTLVALDNMVHPDYQRRGILKRLEAGLAEQRPSDIPYYTFLNENSFPMYVKHFGWTYMGPLGVFMKPLGVGSLAARNPLWRLFDPVFSGYRSFYARRSTGLVAEPFEVFGAEIAGLWERNKSRLGVTFNRSLDYLRWRFSDAPVAYENYEIRDGSGLCGYAVLRIEEKFGLRIAWLLDLLVDGEAPPDTFTGALLAVEERMAGRCDFLSIISPSRDYEVRAKRAGYRKVPSRLLPHQFYFCVRRNDYPSAAVLDRERWYFTWSLHDVL